MQRCATHGRVRGQTPRGETRSGPCTIRYRSAVAFLADYETFVSHGRLFVNTRSPQPVGSTVRVTLACESKGLRCTLSGQVLRSYSFGNPTNDAPGMLIELEEIDEVSSREMGDVARAVRDSRLHGPMLDRGYGAPA